MCVHRDEDVTLTTIASEALFLIWNNSKEKEELDNEMEKIYLEAISSGDDQFSSRNLTCYSNYARLYLAMSDKNRFYKWNNKLFSVYILDQQLIILLLEIILTKSLFITLKDMRSLINYQMVGILFCNKILRNQQLG